MSTTLRLCALSIVAVLPFSVLLAQDTPTKVLVVAAEQRKNGECSEERVLVDRVAYMSGRRWEFEDKAREAARRMLRPDGSLKHFRVIKPGTYAFLFTYKSAGFKCMHALVGLAIGDSQTEAINQMNATLRDAKAGDHDIIRKWPENP